MDAENGQRSGPGPLVRIVLVTYRYTYYTYDYIARWTYAPEFFLFSLFECVFSLSLSLYLP